MDNDSIFRKEALERLSSPEQLDQLMKIVTPRSWLPLAALAGLLGCGLVWSIVGRIPVTTTGKGALVFADALETAMSDSTLRMADEMMVDDMSPKQLVGVAYFSAGEVAQIQPGMDVLLFPDVEGAQVAGGLEATVISVSEPSITTIEAARENKLDETFVEVLTLPAQKEDGSFAWSASSNNMDPIAGMPAFSRVTLKKKAPIAFVFPFLDQLLGE